jgi:hypothetical protein
LADRRDGLTFRPVTNHNPLPDLLHDLEVHGAFIGLRKCKGSVHLCIDSIYRCRVIPSTLFFSIQYSALLFARSEPAVASTSLSVKPVIRTTDFLDSVIPFAPLSVPAVWKNVRTKRTMRTKSAHGNSAQ